MARGWIAPPPVGGAAKPGLRLLGPDSIAAGPGSIAAGPGSIAADPSGLGSIGHAPPVAGPCGLGARQSGPIGWLGPGSERPAGTPSNGRYPKS